MGTVYLVRDEVKGKNVALKVLRADRVGPAALARLQEEFRAIASIHHDGMAGGFEAASLPAGSPQDHDR